MADDTTTRANPRKVREGTVVSASMDKTAVVSVIDRVRHPLYRKTLQRTKKLYVHDETNDLNVGDRVRVQETRPLSKLKRWRLLEVLERAKGAAGEPLRTRAEVLSPRRRSTSWGPSDDPAGIPASGRGQQRCEG